MPSVFSEIVSVIQLFCETSNLGKSSQICTMEAFIEPKMMWGSVMGNSSGDGDFRHIQLYGWQGVELSRSMLRYVDKHHDHRVIWLANLL